MGVIALTTEGEHPSVVTSNNDFSRDGDAILILNADEPQLRLEGTDSNATYDLRVGRMYRDHRSQQGQELADQGDLVLLPGNAAIIETTEW